MADVSNDTKSSEHLYGHAVVVPLSILMLIFIVLSIGGNIMVILTIARHQGLKTRTNMFIINLAVADILVAALDMPISLITILKGRWVFGAAMCKFNGFTMALFLICSIHTLMYIAIHKFISITRPFSRAMTPKRIKMMIAAAWIWSIFCATGPLVGWNRIEYKKGASQCGPGIPIDVGSKTHSLFITTSNYMIPLAVMSFCYTRIFMEIHTHMTRIRDTSNINLATSVTQQKKVSTTLFLVLACFFLCWTPFVAYSTGVAFMKNKEKMPYIFNPLAYWCGYMNSACNPIIYAFRSPSFRKGYKAIICMGIKQDDFQDSKGHSLSFRSKSAKGSARIDTDPSLLSGSQKRKITDTKRKKPFLSQTSWISMPIILMRSLSSAKSTSQAPRKSEDSADCKTLCCCAFEFEHSGSYSPEIPEEKPSINSQQETAFGPDGNIYQSSIKPKDGAGFEIEAQINHYESIDLDLGKNLRTDEESNVNSDRSKDLLDDPENLLSHDSIGEINM